MSLSNLSGEQSLDLNRLMLHYIDGGAFRDVYGFNHDQTKVLKIENENSAEDREFCNVIEYNIWYYVKKMPEVAKWFAPVLDISKCGKFLVMARTRPIKSVPELVPDFLRDCHKGNFGLYRGRVVCHDYAFTAVVKKGVENFKLCKPNKGCD